MTCEDLLNNIYVINLDYRIDRLLMINYKLNELGLKFNKISGMLGSDNREDYERYVSFIKYCQQTNIPVIKELNGIGAYGLLLTYYYKISTLYKLNTHIFILEDDCCFHQNFINLLIKYEEIINTHDVIWLGNQEVYWNENKIESIKKYSYYEPSVQNYPWSLCWGTYSIIYSSKFLKILNQELTDCFNKNKNLLNNIDIFIGGILKKYPFLKGCCIKPDLIIPQVFESDNMGNRDINKMKEDRKWDLSLYKYMSITENFKNIYDNVTNNKISLRNTDIKNIDSELSNIQISKIIENGNKSFVFIITSYNNEEWVYRNLYSIVNQNYSYWRIIYVNDNSSDNTLEKVNDFINKYSIKDKITIISNEKQMRQSYSRFIGAQLCQDDEICCLLDGDDWLVNNNDLLNKLNELYIDNDLNMSYGQFYYFEGDETYMMLSGVRKYTSEEIINNNYRNKWVTQHLRTMKASLFKSIPEDYLKYNGEWLRCCTDMAEMYWCLEISEGKHMNTGFPTVVYNKEASKRYINSYYNQDKHLEEKKYRENVEKYLKTYKRIK